MKTRLGARALFTQRLAGHRAHRSADDDVELELLKTVARQRIAARQGGACHQLFQIQKIFRTARSELATRSIYYRT